MKGSKDTKHWPYAHVNGVSVRTFFTLKLAIPEQRACVSDIQTSQRTRFWFFRTGFSQERQIAAEMLRLLILLFLDMLIAGPGFDAIESFRSEFTANL